VPIVPAAVLFDLGRGGSFTARPGSAFGAAAVAAAGAEVGDNRLGSIGAGTGAVTSGLRGGLGAASVLLPDGSVVAALVVANAVGSPVHHRSGELLGARNLLPTDFPGLRVPVPEHRDAVLSVIAAAGPGTGRAPVLNTSIGVVATSATLTKTQCSKMAAIAHDGLARALDPVHTAYDGDTLFAVSTATDPAPDDVGLYRILTAAADVVTRALVRGLLAAESVRTPAGSWSCYLDLAPSARPR
jgi:putative pantetheine hydrolase